MHLPLTRARSGSVSYGKNLTEGIGLYVSGQKKGKWGVCGPISNGRGGRLPLKETATRTNAMYCGKPSLR
jgi:hypothetical protein